MKKQNGFTLIEVLTVITIIGILIAMGAPSLFNLINSSHLNQTSTVIFDSFQTARQDSRKYGLPIFLSINTNEILLTATDPAKYSKSFKLPYNIEFTGASLYSFNYGINTENSQSTTYNLTTSYQGTKTITSYALADNIK